MNDAFSKSSSISSVIHRTGRSSASGRFSPSFGVRHGLIKDPNWPPAEFPAQGTASLRRHRRVPATFEVGLRGEQLKVSGDLSLGGAMFLAERRIDTQVVDVIVGGAQARAEVLSISLRGAQVAHHCRFLDHDEALPVWKAISTT